MSDPVTYNLEKFRVPSFVFPGVPDDSWRFDVSNNTWQLPSVTAGGQTRADVKHPGYRLMYVVSGGAVILQLTTADDNTGLDDTDNGVIFIRNSVHTAIIVPPDHRPWFRRDGTSGTVNLGVMFWHQ